MSEDRFFEVESAVFRERAGKMEVFLQDSGEFKPYEGDADRVRRLSNPMSLEEVRPYMDVEPKLDDQPASNDAPANQVAG